MRYRDGEEPRPGDVIVRARPSRFGGGVQRLETVAEIRADYIFTTEGGGAPPTMFRLVERWASATN